ncbi:MAG: MgtC/SapB family protein [Ruminococcaceae bacterium]|nr:MgtC/SapB family protein [Oscillospiraceae bacterium]
MGEIYKTLTEYNTVSVLVRLFLAVICGGLIGIERGRKRRPAGFRTHMLVCLGAAVTMLISQHLWLEGYTTDLARLGAQVVSGIGFLGAGTILVTGRHQIKGLTTAAGLWASASIGLAIGAGFYVGALFAFGFVLLTITLFSRLEARLIASARNMNLYVEYADSETLGHVIDNVKRLEVRIYDVEITKNRATEGISTGAILSLRLPKALPHAVVMAEIASSDGVKGVEEL